MGYNVGGIPDIIKDNYNGFLIKPFNFYLFSKKLGILIKNKKLRKKFSLNAKIYSKKNWSHKVIKTKYEKNLSNII